MAVQATGGDALIGPWAKGFPPELWGTSVAALAASTPRLSMFTTPIMAVAIDALAHNERVVFDWARDAGVHLAPHGKTTMAPALWSRLSDAGAWGLTLATPWHVQLARAAGVSRIMLANGLVDTAAAAWIRNELDRDPEFEFSCWADSEAAVWRLAAQAPRARPIDVLVELGGRAGRTGARTIDEGVRIADAIVAAPGLRLVGVAGYEGPFGPDRSAASVAAIDAYLGALGELFTRLDAAGLFDDLRTGGEQAIVSAGGSAFPDRVVAMLGPGGTAGVAPQRADVVLRSGASQLHDDGLSGQLSPAGRDARSGGVWAPGDCARRCVCGHVGSRDRSQGSRCSMLAGAMCHTTSVCRCHSELRDDLRARVRRCCGMRRSRPSTISTPVPIHPGQISRVRSGLSHPCTAFDKWRLVPLIESAEADDPRVLGAVATWF